MVVMVIILLFAASQTTVNAQVVSLDCPESWLMYQSSCYLFSDDKLVIDEADATCWSYGAKLVSVETFQEHKFLSDRLTHINTLERNTFYFTSGKYVGSSQASNRYIYWDGIKRVHSGQTFWQNTPPTGDRTYRIAYMYSNGEYRWTNLSLNVLGGYICEVAKSELQDPAILQRDFDYGRGSYDSKTVKTGPVILQQPGSTIVYDTVSTVQVECVANGNPAPSYTFWKGSSVTDSVQVEPTTRYTLSGGTMTIQDPKEKKDESVYYVLVENDVGIIISEAAHITFGYLGSFPNIELEPLVATPFRGAMLECNEPSYSPKVMFHWFWNSAAEIHIFEGAYNFFVSYSGTLYISEVQPTDAERKYFCVVSLAPSEDAKLGEGLVPSRTSLGQWIYLTGEQGMPDNDYAPIMHTHIFPSNPVVGKRVRLECVAYGRVPIAYSWYRDDGLPFVTGTTMRDRNRVLTIDNATLAAEGNYVCKAVTGSGRVATVAVVLTIYAKPYFKHPIRNILADQGVTLKWYCKAVARPEPYYTWYKNGELLTTKPGINIDEGVLTFLKIDAARDEGMYQCAATNQYGTTFASAQLKVLSIKPNFDRKPLKETLYAAVGSNITIPCTVEAAPVPDVQWFKNGASMNIVRGELNGRIGMSIVYGLVLATVEYSDAAEYRCKATNELGEAEDKTKLIVADGITFLQSPMPTTSMVNTTTFIPCQALYNPVYDITYIWRFNGQIIDPAKSKEYVLGERYNINGLYIRQTQFKHTGLYECEARTPIHSLSASALLSVEGPPAAPAGVYVNADTITMRSVLVIWTNVEDHQRGGIATSYDIEADTTYYPDEWIVVAQDIPDHVAAQEASTAGIRTDQRAHLVTDLIPYTNYRFRIRAMNQFGRGQEPSTPSVIVRLRGSAPVKAPGQVDGGGGSVGTLTITWSVLDISEHCGPGLGYYVYWKDLRSTKDWIREIGTDDMALKDGKLVVTVGVDNYYLPYQVKVGAFNNLGSGPNSTEVTIYSAEGMPQVVPLALDVDGYNGTSIIVNWEPIPSTREAIKGVVRGYRVYYYANLDGETPFEGHDPDPIVNEILFKDVYGNTDHCQLVGLHMNSEYFSRVQVFNGAGFGPKGEWRRSETSNDMLRDHPIFVSVYHRDSHSVIVRWRGITHYMYSESSILGYIVRVWKVQEDIRTATDTVVDSVSEAVVEGLQTKEVYVVRVLGYSGSGDGRLSEAVYFTITDDNIIHIPLDPTTSQMCFSSDDGRTCSAPGHHKVPFIAGFLVIVTTIILRLQILS